MERRGKQEVMTGEGSAAYILNRNSQSVEPAELNEEYHGGWLHNICCYNNLFLRINNFCVFDVYRHTYRHQKHPALKRWSLYYHKFKKLKIDEVRQRSSSPVQSGPDGTLYQAFQSSSGFSLEA